MVDIFSKSKRSEIMSKIRSESELEKVFRKLLSVEIYPSGYRYRINYKKLPGKPDIAFIRQKIAIFIDGDFWHGYQFKKRSRKYSDFWKKKIESNIRRDQRNRRLLKKIGWTYIRFWEHEIRKKPEELVKKIISLL